MRDALDLFLPRHRQPVERFLFANAAQTLSSGNGNHASPVRRERHARDERPAVVEAGMTSAFDDEAAAGKDPGADGRAARATDGLRQRRRVGVEAVELGERSRHRQRELRAGAETGVPRQRSVHADTRSLADVMVVEKSLREAGDPLRIRPMRADGQRLGCREQQRRFRRGRADAAKPPARARREDRARRSAGARALRRRLRCRASRSSGSTGRSSRTLRATGATADVLARADPSPRTRADRPSCRRSPAAARLR